MSGHDVSDEKNEKSKGAWNAGMVSIGSFTRERVSFYSSFLAVSKQRTVDFIRLAQIRLQRWLLNSHKDQVSSHQLSHCSYPLERIIFRPKDSEHQEPMIALEGGKRSYHGLVLPVCCRGPTVFYANKGGGVFWLKSSRGNKSSKEWCVSLVRTAPSSQFRFKVIVLLPSWTRKYFKDTVIEWYNRYQFIDAIFIIDCKFPQYWVFADKEQSQPSPRKKLNCPKSKTGDSLLSGGIRGTEKAKS